MSTPKAPVLENLVREAFTEVPTKTLFHYTSYSGLLGISQATKLRLTEVQHLNDTQEIRDFRQALFLEINSRIEAFNKDPDRPGLTDFSSPKMRDFYNMRSFESGYS